MLSFGESFEAMQHETVEVPMPRGKRRELTMPKPKYSRDELLAVLGLGAGGDLHDDELKAAADALLRDGADWLLPE